MRRSLRARSPRLDRPLVEITRAANYSRLWLLLALGLATCAGQRGQRAAVRGILAIAIAAALANGPAKLLVRRRRPPQRSPPTLIRMPRSTSFPSGHSATAFAFATGACAELPILAPVLVPLAGAVAYSRVHTGVHYPSDVAAGAAIGIGSGILAGRLPRWVRRRRAVGGGRAAVGSGRAAVGGGGAAVAGRRAPVGGGRAAVGSGRAAIGGEQADAGP